MVMFLLAGDVGWVTAARAVQGFATGAATSAFTAEIVELSPPERPALGGVIGSTAPAGGLALGALLTGAAVQLAANPRSLTFVVLTGVMAAGTALACFLPDTTPRRRGALRSLRPHLSVPRAAAAEFIAAIPAQVAAWMLAGLFLGLVPTVMREVFHHDSGLLNGATAFVEPATAAVAILFLGRRTPREATRLGCWAIASGTLVIVVGISAQLLALIWIGGVVLVDAKDRAGLFAALYLVAYLAFGLPSVIAGQLAAHSVSVRAIATAYGITVVVAALLGSIAQARQSRAQVSRESRVPAGTARPGSRPRAPHAREPDRRAAGSACRGGLRRRPAQPCRRSSPWRRRRRARTPRAPRPLESVVGWPPRASRRARSRGLPMAR